MQPSTNWSIKQQPEDPPADAPAEGLPSLRAFALVSWRKDREGRYTDVSATFHDFFRLAGTDSLIGLHDRDLFPPEIAQAYEAGDQEVMRLRQPVVIEETYPYGWLETVKLPLFDDLGEVAGTYGFARDISEQRRLQQEKERSERNFRSLTENSPDIILRFDRAGLLAYCNPASLRFAGVETKSVLGKPVKDHGVLPPADARRFSACISEVLSEGHPRDIEFRWELGKQGKHVQMHVVPEYDTQGQVCSVLAVGHDVTELSEARAQLRHSRDLLHALANHRQAEYESERRDIAHRIHEDLAQSLSALRVHLSLLANAMPGLRNNGSLACLFDITDRCIGRTRDVVTALRPTVLDMGLAPALRWLADDFRKGLGLQFRLALPEEAVLDDLTATFLFRAAQEILINTALHAAATEVRLGLRQADGQVVLDIEDNGRGFDPVLPRPKEAFGLLGISEQARYLDGNLDITSSPGWGTRIEIRVPDRQTQGSRQEIV